MPAAAALAMIALEGLAADVDVAGLVAEVSPKDAYTAHVCIYQSVDLHKRVKPHNHSVHSKFFMVKRVRHPWIHSRRVRGPHALFLLSKGLIRRLGPVIEKVEVKIDRRKVFGE